MVGFPRVSMHQPFKLKTEKLDWRTSKKDLEAWKNGQNGLSHRGCGNAAVEANRLDAQSAANGHRHVPDQEPTDRLAAGRASTSWKRSSMEDLAANNGGWQWSASTGTDAVPYFRDL